MYTCIYSRTQFESATREHILQNSLGARWDSPEIVSNQVQQEFSETIDKALEIGLKEYRTLLGSEGGRGGAPRALKVETTEGRTVLVGPGGVARLAEPRVVPVPGNPHSFHIEISSAADAGWVAKKIHDLFPNVDIATAKASIEAALGNPPKVTSDPTDRLKLTPILGGEEFFRAILKAAFNLLGVKDTALALDPIFDPLRDFVRMGKGGSRDFARWPTQRPVGLPSMGEFDHWIAVYSRGSEIEAFAQFFGAFHWSLRLASGYQGPEFCHAYQVDPLREAEPAENRSPNATNQSFPLFASGSEEQDETVRRYGQAQSEGFLNRYLTRAYRKQQNAELEAAIAQAWGPADGRKLTQADIDRATEAMLAVVLRRLETDKSDGGQTK
jgi:hypothetical protein